jgi:integrase
VLASWTDSWQAEVLDARLRPVRLKEPKMSWIKRWNRWIDPEEVVPGVWKRKEGGFVIRKRVTDPKTGKLVEVIKTLPDACLAEAKTLLAEEVERVRQGGTTMTGPRPRFGGFAVSLFERKLARGEIRSEKGKEKWCDILKNHLVPFFGEFFVDQIRRADVEAWKDKVAEQIEAKEYSPNTANTWLAVLKVVMNAGVAELELDRNPIMGVSSFDTSTHRTYTRAQPNSLLPVEVPLFLTEMLEAYPQHYGMVVLGLVTGWRPSSLRPLRRRGPEADIDWDTGTIEIRRSHTRKQKAMEKTKTGHDSIVTVPKEILETLRWHVDNLPEGPMRDSDLLFPSEKGGFRSPSVLDKPFRAVVRKLELQKKITPRALRRSYNDLTRAAGIADIVTRSISGHQTEAMQRRYSTVAANEQKEAISKVFQITGARRTGTHG